MKDDFDPYNLSLDVDFHPSSASMAAAGGYLGRHKEVLALVDAAVQRPKCWFNRDWSLPDATLYPELAEMKTAAKALCLRGALSARRGDTAVALADAQRIFVVSKHVGYERTPLSGWVSEAIYSIGLKTLAEWSFAYPKEPRYRAALKEAVEAFPRPNLHDDHRTLLIFDLTLIDLSQTPEGRKKFGLKPGDSPGLFLKVVSMFRSQGKAKIAVVKAERDYWEALDRPETQRSALLTAATARRNTALLAFPLAAELNYDLRDPGTELFDREMVWEVQKLQYRTLLRGFIRGLVLRKVDTADLRSPIDGGPVTYHFDGKQIVIGVSGFDYDSKPDLLKIPPDQTSGK